MFAFQTADPGGIARFIGLRHRRSWRRSDGVHRFASVTFGLPRRASARVVEGDPGEVADAFFDGI